jgi:hypothetical protein
MNVDLGTIRQAPTPDLVIPGDRLWLDTPNLCGWYPVTAKTRGDSDQGPTVCFHMDTYGQNDLGYAVHIVPADQPVLVIPIHHAHRQLAALTPEQTGQVTAAAADRADRAAHDPGPSYATEPRT